MVMKRLKNATVADKNWRGQTIKVGEYFEIPYNEERKWANDADVATDITSGDLVANDGTSDLAAGPGLEHIQALDAQCIQTVLIDDTAPADGDALIYDAAMGKWKPGEAVPSPVICVQVWNENTEGNGMFFDLGGTAGVWTHLTAFTDDLNVGSGFERQKIAIDSFPSSKKVRLVGDYTSYFRMDNTVRIANSTNNDGTYTIKSNSVFTGGGTEIEFDQTLPNITLVDGDVMLGEYKVLAPAVGWLAVDFLASVDGNNFDVNVGVFINGTLVNRTETMVHPPGSGDNVVIPVHALVQVALNDIIEIRFRSLTSTNKEGWLDYVSLTLRKY